jgi:hypothetical protein
MIVRSFFATGGVLTPRHGCSRVIWSLNAVVNTADRMVWHCRITVADAPAVLRSVTHSRTSAVELGLQVGQGRGGWLFGEPAFEGLVEPFDAPMLSSGRR